MNVKRYGLPAFLALLLNLAATNAVTAPTTFSNSLSNLLAENSRRKSTLIDFRLAQAAVSSESIYVADNGDFLGTRTILFGTGSANTPSSVVFIDNSGELSLVTRDYTADVTYDYQDRITRIGTTDITYDYRGRVEQIGATPFSYDYRSRVGQVGDAEIAYTARGQVDRVGDVTLEYDQGLIDTISSNYTSSGARVIVVERLQ